MDRRILEAALTQPTDTRPVMEQLQDPNTSMEKIVFNEFSRKVHEAGVTINFDEYQEHALRSEAPPDKLCFQRLSIWLHLIVNHFGDIRRTGLKLDALKKYVFYNRRESEPSTAPAASERLDKFLEFIEHNVFNTVGTEILEAFHGLIGLGTELEELADILCTPINNVAVGLAKSWQIDKVHVEEECGDILWYVSLICKAFDISFQTVAEKNILKLIQRFPDRYTDEAAEVRDLDAERAVLEGTHSAIGIIDAFKAGTIDVEEARRQLSSTENQEKFNACIGRLDQCLSELIGYAKTLPADSPNRQTLKHHAEDMVGAGEKILGMMNYASARTPSPLARGDAVIGPRCDMCRSTINVTEVDGRQYCESCLKK